MLIDQIADRVLYKSKHTDTDDSAQLGTIINRYENTGSDADTGYTTIIRLDNGTEVWNSMFFSSSFINITRSNTSTE